jgi:3-deoxy-D-manno-octulosonic-acid transferase
MIILYTAGILFYDAILHVFALFNTKANLLVQGRKRTVRLIKNLNFSEQTIWIHCASLGEFEQGRPVIEALKKKDPNQKIILTFFSPSGYEMRKNYELADYVFYLPSDRPRLVKKFVKAINPRAAIFVKYEFWYYYLRCLHKNKINTYIVSAIFRKEHVFFKWYGVWFKKMLRFFTMLYVQDEKSAFLLNKIGIANHQVVGDTRFDRVYQIAQKANSYPLLEEFAKGHKVIVGGSTWPADEKLLAEYLKVNKEVKLILDHIQQIEQVFDVPLVRYANMSEAEMNGVRVIIVNTMGMLSSIYQYGDMAYIGGGFGVGIHNTLEAATFGLPVVFGPNYKKFNEACSLIELGAGFSVNDQNSFNKVTERLLQDSEYLNNCSNAAKTYIKSMIGATEKIADALYM